MTEKKKTIAQLVDAAAILLQKYVRLKAADENGYVTCVTCGKTDHYKHHMQGGHFISRSSTSTKLMEENIHIQCKTCNVLLKGNMIKYTLYMLEYYGQDFVDELLRLKHVTKKYSRSEVVEITQDLRQKIKELE